jgi:PIN domain-containing protein
VANPDFLEKNQVVEFPILQLALAAIKGRVDVLTLRSLGFSAGEGEDVPLVEIRGSPNAFRLRILAEQGDYLDWLNGALLRAGMVEPAGLTAVARRLAEYEDIVLGVDTNLLYSAVLGEHLLEEFHRIHARPYKETVNWILVVIPGVVMKELENAANQKKGGHLTHAGRMGYRALQEITALKRTEAFQGMSVLVVGQTNPEQLRVSPEGLTILNADSMIRDQFKTFLRGIEFRKGIFFLTMDKTNASMAAAEGLSALRIQHPRRLRKGDEVEIPKEEAVLLARVVYELAVEYGKVRIAWNDGGAHHLDLEGEWTWKSMEHWEDFQLLVSDTDPGFAKALNRYVGGRFDPRRVLEEWTKLREVLTE